MNDAIQSTLLWIHQELSALRSANAAGDIAAVKRFTDVSPTGPKGLFTSAQVEQFLEVLDQAREMAVAA